MNDFNFFSCENLPPVDQLFDQTVRAKVGELISVLFPMPSKKALKWEIFASYTPFNYRYGSFGCEVYFRASPATMVETVHGFVRWNKTNSDGLYHPWLGSFKEDEVDISVKLISLTSYLWFIELLELQSSLLKKNNLSFVKSREVFIDIVDPSKVNVQIRLTKELADPINYMVKKVKEMQAFNPTYYYYFSIEGLEFRIISNEINVIGTLNINDIAFHSLIRAAEDFLPLYSIRLN